MEVAGTVELLVDLEDLAVVALVRTLGPAQAELPTRVAVVAVRQTLAHRVQAAPAS